MTLSIYPPKENPNKVIKNSASIMALTVVVNQGTMRLLPVSFTMPPIPKSSPRGAVTNEYKIIVKAPKPLMNNMFTIEMI